MDYRYGDCLFWLSTHDCQVPAQTYPNVEVEQQIWIFEIFKSRNTNVFTLDVMHQGQTNSSIAGKIEFHIL
jgi:hypothetical protein